MRRTGIGLALVLFLWTCIAGLVALNDTLLDTMGGAALAASDDQTIVSRGHVLAEATWTAPQGITSATGEQLTTTTPIATITPTATPTPRCNVSAEGFNSRGNQVALQLLNHGPTLASIHTIEIAWPVGDNGPLTEIWLRDRVIWRGQADRSPASIAVGAVGAIPPTILPGDTAALTFVFTPDDDDEVVEAHYAISVSFYQGCHVLYSTRQPVDTTCEVEAGLFAVRGHKAVLTVHNVGTTDAELRAIQIAWPVEHNGALTQVKAGAMTLWEGERASSPTIIIPTAATERPLLHPGERVILTFTFSQTGAEQPYTITFFFVEGCYASYSTNLKPTTPRTVRLGGAIEALPDDGLLGAWTVAGHTVLVDERTIIEPSNTQPAVGDEVKVTAIVLQDAAGVSDKEQLLAIHIRLTEDKGGRKVEFRGVVEQIRDDGQEIIVRGITVMINDRTQIVGQLAVGSLAYVQGKLRDHDKVLADRIVLVSLAADVVLVQFEGPVESFPAGQLGTWQIGGRTVLVDATTVIEGTPTVGVLAEVQAQLTNNGTLLARHIAIQEQQVTPVSARIRGVIAQLPDPPLLLGNWVIGNIVSSENVTVSVTVATFIDQSQARARVGAAVEVNMVRQPDGTWHATRIKVKRED